MAWYSRRRSGAASLTSAATPVPNRNREAEPGASLQPWQQQAWTFFHELGELHYAGGFYRRMLSNLRLFVETRSDPDGWQETDNVALQEQLQRLESSTGGMARLQGTYGELTFVQGECYLTLTILGDPLDPPESWTEVWEMVSVSELAFNKSSATSEFGEYQRKRHKNGSTPEKIPGMNPDDPQPGTMQAWRFMHSDPQFSGDPDAPMRAVLEDCEELYLLKQAVRNTARNRGAGNGVLVMTSQLGAAMVDAGDGTQVSATAKMVYDALTAPIANEQSASAVAPVIVFADPPQHGTLRDSIFHVDLRGAALYQETGLRDEAIRRIEIGLDMPSGSLLGVTNTNHWNAWAIDESAWKNHGEPVAREFVGYLTAALIQPLAAELGLNPQDVRVWFDATAVVEDPDRGAAAAEALDRMAISTAAYRRETGWKEEDAMPDDEFEQRIQIGHAPRGTTPAEKAGQEPVGGQTSADRIIGLAEACVIRCREKAGAKLRPHAEKVPNLRVRVNGKPNDQLGPLVGRDIGIDPDLLCIGGGAVFMQKMIDAGLDPNLAPTLVTLTEEHASKTLFESDPGPLPREVLLLCELQALKAPQTMPVP